MKTLIKRFIDIYVPTEKCNFKCSYCYLGQKNKQNGEINPIGHSSKEIRDALSMKRWGGTMFLNFCAGGETLLGEDILPVILELLKEGHFVQIVTNGSVSGRFREISKWSKEYLDRLFVKFSFHYIELKRLNLLDNYFENVQLMRNNGVSISLEITPCDDMLPMREEMKSVCLEKVGAMPHITVARDESSPGWEILTTLSKDEYIEAWKSFESPMFDLKMKLLSEKREEFCYGGEWTFSLNLSNGSLKQCYRGDVIDNIYKNINDPIHYHPIGHNCRECYCYNGHAWMTWGCIPDVQMPTYAEMRNRKSADGTEWLSETIKGAFSEKLEHANTIYKKEKILPKIWLLGDSISIGYMPYVKDGMKEKAEVYSTGEVCRDTTNLLRYVAEWAEKLNIGSDIDLVYFNVGLWDLLRIYGDEPLVSVSEYEANLRRIVRRLRFVCPNAKLVFATITSVSEEASDYSLFRCNSDVRLYNRVAMQVMKENEIFVHDLNIITSGFDQNLYLDMVHYTERGYRILGAAVKEMISKELSL